MFLAVMLSIPFLHVFCNFRFVGSFGIGSVWIFFLSPLCSTLPV